MTPTDRATVRNMLALLIAENNTALGLEIAQWWAEKTGERL
jgi:hypothetical protein